MFIFLHPKFLSIISTFFSYENNADTFPIIHKSYYPKATMKYTSKVTFDIYQYGVYLN